MGLIQKPVGLGGRNNQQDVQVVEYLLNRVLPVIYAPDRSVQNGKYVFEDLLTRFPVDGQIDDQVIQVIKDFQKNVLGFKWPDGRVDPDRNSIRMLGRLFAKQGGVIPLTREEADKRIDPHASFERKGGNFQTQAFRCGQTVAGLDGSRLILNINHFETVFLLLDDAGPGDELKDQNPMRAKPGTFYKQDTAAFFDELDSMFFHDLAKELKGVKTLIAVEIGIITSIASASNIAFTVILLSPDIIKFIDKNHKKFVPMAGVIAAVLVVRSTLKKHTPTLYKKLIKGLFIGVSAGLLGAVGLAGPDAVAGVPAAMVKDPMTIGKLVGALIASVGKESLEKRLTLFGAVVTILKELAKKAAQTAAGNLGVPLQEKMRCANEIIRHLRASGVQITEAEAKTIVDEVTVHAKVVKEALDDLAKAVQQL